MQVLLFLGLYFSTHIVITSESISINVGLCFKAVSENGCWGKNAFIHRQNQKPQSSCIFDLPVGVGRHCKGITEGHTADWALLGLTWTLDKAARLIMRHLLADVSASTGLLYWQLAQQQLTPSTHQKKNTFQLTLLQACAHTHNTARLLLCHACVGALSNVCGWDHTCVKDRLLFYATTQRYLWEEMSLSFDKETF